QERSQEAQPGERGDEIEDVLDLEAPGMRLREGLWTSPLRQGAARHEDRDQRRAAQESEQHTPGVERAVAQARTHAREQRQLDDQIRRAVLAMAEGRHLRREARELA